MRKSEKDLKNDVQTQNKIAEDMSEKLENQLLHFEKEKAQLKIDLESLFN